ncbi:hypothetical protein HJD18_10445 [Thermoleophilia bacterium SCSIO 60948]|nr:hypothetical protein HJD18_10445 [Thermoleophilia bacterium SCSIO 60948]
MEQLTTEQRASKRDLDRAVSPLQDYYRQVETGEREHDPNEEAELQAAVAKAQQEVAPQVVFNPRSGGVDGSSVELVNPKIEGQLTGAREALVTAENELDAFIRRRFDDLAVDIAALGRDFVARYRAVMDKARQASEEYVELRGLWRPLLEKAEGMDWSQLPTNPFGGLEELVPPVPAGLLDGESSIRPPSPPKSRRRRAA